MNFRISDHAIEQMILRDISRETILDILNNPDKVILKHTKQVVYQKSINFENDIYLYRVFVNPLVDPQLVITLYRTSKLKKYI